jgi:hypothetical protein
MKRDAWCPEDLSLEVNPPLVSADRSAANTDRVLEQFADQARYVKRDVDGHPGDETFCNFFVRDTLLAQRISIPRGTVNQLIAFFTTSNDWSEIRPWVAQQLVRLGVPVVVLWANPEGHGHIARLRSPRPGDDPNGWYIAQAGLTNFIYGTLGSGFGARPVRFFAHP